MTNDDFDAAFTELQTAFVANLPARLAEIMVRQSELTVASSSDDRLAALDGLQPAVHYLVGAGATFGFDVISDTAQPLDIQLREMLKNGHVPTDGDIADLGAMLAAVVATVQDVLAAA